MNELWRTLASIDARLAALIGWALVLALLGGTAAAFVA